VPFEQVFALDVRFGRCVGVAIPDDFDLADVGLLEVEKVHAGALPVARRAQWVAGRRALREAIASLGGVGAGAILPDDRGAPILPPGFAGSVSHKGQLAVALAARAEGFRIGVDLERVTPRPMDLAARILTADERARLDETPEHLREAEVLWAFSTKEAVYKALDPFVRRFVGFQEVATWRGVDGRAFATLRLKGGEGPFAVEVDWMRRGDWIITSARVQPGGATGATGAMGATGV
jgi:4'-phosphopantetheinyl transferase EntD